MRHRIIMYLRDTHFNEGKQLLNVSRKLGTRKQCD